MKPTLWIIDGHNVIFAIPELRELQTGGMRTEARQGLVDDLRSFAEARSSRCLVVFDGQDVGSNPGTERGGRVEVIYGAPRGGGADALILRQAEMHLARKCKVVVVTNDVATIARLLPARARHLSVESFVDGMTVPSEGAADLSEEEKRIWLASDEAAAAPPRYDRDGGVRAPGMKHGPPVSPPLTPEEAARALVQEKKERGRLRHARRVERRQSSPRRR